jgi:hypothetical protein
MPTMKNINCEKYADRCKELEEVYEKGLSMAKLQQIGIQPGSNRAKELEDGLKEIYIHCCTRMHQGPMPPPVSESSVMVIPRPITIGQVNIAPLISIILIAAAVAATWRWQFCPLIGSRLRPDGNTECRYRCAGGIIHTWIIGPGQICAPFYLHPV